jgi:hypothetical protein
VDNRALRLRCLELALEHGRFSTAAADYEIRLAGLVEIYYRAVAAGEPAAPPPAGQPETVPPHARKPGR